MRGAVRMLTVVAALASACRGDDKHDEEGTADRAPVAGASGHERAKENVLRIDPEMMRDLRLTTAKAEARHAGERVDALGELHVNEDAYAEVGSPIAARVVKLLAGPGDAVKAGQVLAELDSPDLGKARAEYLAAQARADFAHRTLERKRTLAADRIVPAREIQEAEGEAAHVDAELRAARASVGAFGTDMGRGASHVLLRTPIGGTVIERHAVVGRLTDPAAPLFRVGDLSRLWLTVQAFERDAVRLKPGVSARITFPALPGKKFEGAVTLIGREVDATSRTIPIRIEVANGDGVLRPGMSASASIPLGDDQAAVVTVPIAAVQRVEDRWSVFLPTSPATFEIRPIGRGRELDGEVEVPSGLKAGETIVVDGAFLLKAEVDKSHGEGGHDD